MISESQFMAGVFTTLQAMEVGKTYYISPEWVKKYNVIRKKRGWTTVPAPSVVKVSDNKISVNNQTIEVGPDIFAFTFAFAFPLAYPFAFAFALPFGHLVDEEGTPLLVLPEEDPWFLAFQDLTRNMPNG